MRTTSRLAISSVILGGSLLIAPAASADEACPYPFDPADPRCVETENTANERVPAGTAPTTQDAATLPFTGGEITVLSLLGAGALAGGVALVAVGRKRKTA